MKYVLITGGAGGLGFASAKALADRGWTVFAADINQDALDKISHDRIIPLQMDITDIESIKNAASVVEKTTQHLDCVINFAGALVMASLVEDDPALMEKMLAINVMGMIKVNYVFFEFIERGNGRIVNISSEIGWLSPQPFNGPYSTTKHAVEAYTDSLRRELAYIGIPVVKIQPGSFKTEMHNGATQNFKRLLSQTTHYEKQLKRMEFMMTAELKHAKDPKYLVAAVIKAVEKKRPKMLYRVKNSVLLQTLNIFPEKVIDMIYLAFFKINI